jgi:hypothetical protein
LPENRQLRTSTMSMGAANAQDSAVQGNRAH